MPTQVQGILLSGDFPVPGRPSGPLLVMSSLLGAGLGGGHSGSHQPGYLMAVPVDKACPPQERC